MNTHDDSRPPGGDSVDNRRTTAGYLIHRYNPGRVRDYPPARMTLPDERDYERHIVDRAKFLGVTERNLAYEVELRRARIEGGRRERGAA